MTPRRLWLNYSEQQRRHSYSFDFLAAELCACWHRPVPVTRIVVYQHNLQTVCNATSAVKPALRRISRGVWRLTDEHTTSCTMSVFIRWRAELTASYRDKRIKSPMPLAVLKCFVCAYGLHNNWRCTTRCATARRLTGQWTIVTQFGLTLCAYRAKQWTFHWTEPSRADVVMQLMPSPRISSQWEAKKICKGNKRNCYNAVWQHVQKSVTSLDRWTKHDKLVGVCLKLSYGIACMQLSWVRVVGCL